VPDITASPAVDVALGLIFLFFLLSLICSTVSEFVAGVLSWRSRFLEDGLRSMLSGEHDTPEADALVKELAAHPLISGKVATPATGRPRGLRGRVSDLRARLVRRRSFPSYLNSKTFALTFLDTVAPPEAGRDLDVLARARAYAETLPADNPVRRALVAFLDQAGKDVNRFRRSIETWFDLTMDRVSGWYKRRTQASLCVIAAIVTLVFNADALQVGRALWNDDAVRAAVVAQAQEVVEAGEAEPDVGQGVSQSAETLAEQVADVRGLELPLGWSTNPEDPRWFDSAAGAVGKLLGLLATILALTLGAPFWFDLLGRVSRVRTTGKPERAGAF
jgi:hypothetical protein